MFLIEFIPWSDWMARNCQAVSPGISRMNTVVCPDSRIMGTMMSLGKGTQETPPGNVGRPHLLNVASICFRSSSFTYPSVIAPQPRRQPEPVKAKGDLKSIARHPCRHRTHRSEYRSRAHQTTEAHTLSSPRRSWPVGTTALEGRGHEGSPPVQRH